MPRSRGSAALAVCVLGVGLTGLTGVPNSPAAADGLSVELPPPSSPAATPFRLAADSPVRFLDVPDDPRFSDQARSLEALRLPQAWDVTTGNGSVVVAVIDSGVAVDHPDLLGKVVDTYNAVTGGSGVADRIGHGTVVASAAAAATDNGLGLAGSGRDISLLAIKVADKDRRITNAYVARGIDWAVAHGADVINLSLGSTTDHAGVRRAVADAQAADVVVVAAAGNDGKTRRFYPAALPGVLAVGATTVGGGHRAGFSQHGQWVDVGAPGVAIVGANADWATEPDYVAGSGTSFAAPLVAGVVGLVRSVVPSMPQDEVRRTVVQTSRAKTYGFRAGLVDAEAAVLAALPPP